jgi:predicted metal-dependent enzyme (double-stranded beta helix superfamily)
MQPQTMPDQTASDHSMPAVTGQFPPSLATAIRAAVRAAGSWQQAAEAVAAALRGRLPGPDLLSAEQLAGDPAGYRTHLVHAEPDGTFSVAVLVWLPGQATPVHDHLSWCVSAVLAGTEHEEIFRLVPGPAGKGGHFALVARADSPAGTVSGFAPPGDIHRVTNVGSTVAVSLHVYGTDLSRVGSSVRRVYELPVH